MSYTPNIPKKLGIHILQDISIDTLLPYIDWRFFFMAWRLSGKFTDIDLALKDENLWLNKFSSEEKPKAIEALSLYKDALALIEKVKSEKLFVMKGIIGLFEAKSEGENIVFFHKQTRVVLPTLRQQEYSKDGLYFALSDFISPEQDYCGTFAVTVHGAEELSKSFEESDDHYNSILVKTLADRFGEAAAEWLHEVIRKEYWGYAANESISVDDMLKVRYVGIRPAVGYPSLPDQSVIFDLVPILPFAEINVRLTENGAMYPNASVCGIVISHPKSQYFNIGKIDHEQLADYAQRRAKSPEEMKKWLAHNLS